MPDAGCMDAFEGGAELGSASPTARSLRREDLSKQRDEFF
jgi:hypothetical protein